MKKTILFAGIVIAGITLLSSQLRQFKDSVSFFISAIGIPKFTSGFLEIPATVSFVNASPYNINVDQIMITIYRLTNGIWQNIGTSNPGGRVSIPSGSTTDVVFSPRISLLQGFFPSLNAFISTGSVQLRLGVRVKVAGQFLPEQYEDFNIGQIRQQ